MTQQQDTTALTIDAYNASAQQYFDKFQNFALYQDVFDAFVARLLPGARVLDLGCGPGNTTKYMLQQKPSLRFTGVDLSQEMVRLAAKNVPSARFFVQDLRSLDLEGLRFDAAVASFCLPHLTNDEADAFLKSMASLLYPGAFAYLSTMQGEGSRVEDASFSDGRELFYNFYSRAFLDALLKKHGFTAIEYVEKEYPERDGSVTIDMLYVLQRN